MLEDLKGLRLVFSKGEIQLLPQENDSVLLPLSVDHGDSGGPLFCAKSGQDPQLVGVIGGYHYLEGKQSQRSSNFFAATWLNLKP